MKFNGQTLLALLITCWAVFVWMFWEKYGEAFWFINAAALYPVLFIIIRKVTGNKIWEVPALLSVFNLIDEIFKDNTEMDGREYLILLVFILWLASVIVRFIKHKRSSPRNV